MSEVLAIGGDGTPVIGTPFVADAAVAARIVQQPRGSLPVLDGQRLPASYANFYIANHLVLVPTFNDPADRSALEILARCFPDRDVVGIHAVDLVWGLGTLHCLTLQQPAHNTRQQAEGSR